MKTRWLAITVLLLTLLVATILQVTPALAMKQIIIGGYADPVSKTTDEYIALQGGGTWDNAASFHWQVVPTAGSFSRFSVELSGVPGTRTYVFTLMVNGSASALAVTIAADGTQGLDTDTVDVVAGDYVYIRQSAAINPDNTPTARWSIQFSGSTANESIVLGIGQASTLGTMYYPVQHGEMTYTSAEADTYEVIPTAGSIKKLYVKMEADPGTAPDDYRFRLRVNGADSDNGSGQPLSVTIVADNTTGNDTTHTIPLTAGKYVDLQVTPENSPATTTRAAWGMVFVADTDGEALIMGQSSAAPSTSVANYNYLTSTIYNEAWSTTERYQGTQAPTESMVIEKFYIKAQNSPAVGKSYTFTIRGDSANTTITVALSGAATTGNDTSHTYTCTAYGELGIIAVPAGSPNSGWFSWGVVVYLNPVTIDISVSPTTYNFGFVSTNTSYTTANTSYFTIDNNSTTQTDQTISVTTSNWSGGVQWINSDTATQGANQAGLLANRGGTWGVNDITIKFASPNFIYENCPASTGYSFGIELLTPTSVTDGVQKTIVVRITAAAG